ncbi:tetratricopeptide repeat protein [uncultured Pseudoalteromonas sp.]|uniref:tetratricopeptide repeat protein n=2 Tax=Pseudoalteromonas sp. TaxID=53249 RepID=UPI0025994E94|nr:tetratricopeptide repeat protein [uncultured Pseudoalteromonas sp.]
MNIFFNKLRLLVVFYLVAISSLAHSQNMQAQMADFINGFHNFKQFNGNVLVAKDGKVLFEQSFGYELMQMDELDAAITVFELNNQSYPESANTFDSLGEAYLAVGDKQKALASYKSALKLNPDSESAKQAIEKLQ